MFVENLNYCSMRSVKREREQTANEDTLKGLQFHYIHSGRNGCKIIRIAISWYLIRRDTESARVTDSLLTDDVGLCMLRNALFPGFSTRSAAKEWMDADSISTAQLEPALRDLRLLNGLLGGYRASARTITSLMKTRSRVKILDIGTGGGDHLLHLIKHGQRLDCRADVTGIDVNPKTVELARDHVHDSVSGPVRSRVTLAVEDALDLPYAKDTFDVTHAALVLHHLHGSKPVQLLREMDRVGRDGIIVNDLHRHPLAYAGIWMISRLLRLAPMVQNDAPLSVRRGFSKSELETLATEAELCTPTLRWHWAFRWTLSTVSRQES